VTRNHIMPFGAQIVGSGVRFRIWAPGAHRISLKIEGTTETFSLRALDDGWHELITSGAHAGSRYSFILPDGSTVPDPASRFQPDDVHAPSEVIDPAQLIWSDEGWAGRPWVEAVVYELHVGAFTREGTFAAAASRLGHLAALGITAIEIMPVADFPGRRNWGYDGVLLFAPDSTYGRPEDFKRFVQAAHAVGIMVFLDVVYNHFGPDGNYLPSYASAFFTDRHKTPWGNAVNFDGTGSGSVREFVIQNAMYWIDEFHLDGLRLDAVHAIIDDGPEHVLEELARRVRSATTDRPIHLLLENEENSAKLLRRDADGRPAAFTAQWNDDMHHVLHSAASSEASGYYADYLGDTEKLGRALSEGFAFQGEVMPYRGTQRGERSAHLPPDAFVAFIQNHDQVGNRAFGDRLTSVAPLAAVRAVTAVYLLLPQIPLLFMGEEWAAEQPFPFFCDFSGELAKAVSEGRRGEFARFPEFADPQIRAKIPDPEADGTFASAKLDWDVLNLAPHAETLDRYQRILAARHAVIVPLIPALSHGGTYEVLAPGAVVVRWIADNGKILTLLANLSGAAVPEPPLHGMRFWTEGNVEESVVSPWSVAWSLEKPL
jgi:maltooligosyltrehalose trehalohydrolase